MNVLVVGLNHQIQRADILSGGDDIERLERDQKLRFAQYLAEIIQERNVALIGEEAQHGVTLIAQRVAKQLGCQYRNIEIPPDIRAARGIPNDYTREDRPYTQEQRVNWHREREDYMIEQFLLTPAYGNAVLLCGREHVEALANQLRNAGHRVDTYDLNREDWYIEDWLQHVMFN